MKKKMIWLYRCDECESDLIALTAFLKDESPPVKESFCLMCQRLSVIPTMRPVRQLSPDDLWRWLHPKTPPGWDLVAPVAAE